MTEFIISDIHDSIEVLIDNYRDTGELCCIDWITAYISITNQMKDCYKIMNDVMFHYRVAPEFINYNESYCVFEYKGLFFWIGFTVVNDYETKIDIYFEVDICDFEISRPYIIFDDRCDGWAEDGLFSWMNDI